MNQELILLLGDTIREKRGGLNITLEQLASKAGVSKGLISQIENNRTVPSLPVLFNLIHSLGEDLKTFFGSMHDQVENGKVLIVRQGEAREFKKEPIRKFVYKRILTKSISSEATDIVLLELEVGAERKKMIQTDAFECKYVLRGSIEYQVMDEKFVLNPGDTLFYDGRLRHRLKNIGKTRAQILIIYFF